MSAQTNEMFSVECTGVGGTECLALASNNPSVPSCDELLIRVDFAGVAFADTMLRNGTYHKIPAYPFVPGYDCAGIIIDGSADGFNIGDRVVGFFEDFGCYTQTRLATPQNLVKIPDDVLSEKAVCLVLNYLSAFHLLRNHANVKAGDVVVVTSAAGGVGTAVLELGKIWGLKMYGTASTSKLGIVEERGATPIDYRSVDFEDVIRTHEPQGVDLFIDQVSGDTMTRGYRLLKRGGKLVVNGMLSVKPGDRRAFYSAISAHFFRKLIPDGKRLAFNFGLPPYIKKNPKWYQETMAELLSLASSGKIDPLVGMKIPLENAHHAHEALEQGRACGKIVLDCQSRNWHLARGCESEPPERNGSYDSSR